jgi:hypothetical protein
MKLCYLILFYKYTETIRVYIVYWKYRSFCESTTSNLISFRTILPTYYVYIDVTYCIQQDFALLWTHMNALFYVKLYVLVVFDPTWMRRVTAYCFL